MVSLARIAVVVALPALAAACASAPMKAAEVDLRDACVFSPNPADRPKPRAMTPADPIMYTLSERGRRIPVRRFTGRLDQLRFEKEVEKAGCPAPNLG